MAIFSDFAERAKFILLILIITVIKNKKENKYMYIKL